MTRIRRPARRLALAATLLALAAAPAAVSAARAEGAARFGAAEVTCTPEKTCVAVVRSRTEAGSGDAAAVLTLHREPGSRARWAISLATVAALADAERPMSLAVDGGVSLTLRPRSDYAPFVTPETFYVVSQYALDRLMRDLQVGFELRFSYVDIAGAPHMDRFRLDGLRDAMTEIDRRQGRIVGDRRAGAPEGLPPAPAVDARGRVAAEGVPPRLLERHLATDCEAPDGPGLADAAPVIGSLSDTAMLYAIPCWRSAGRTGYRLYLLESGEIGGIHPLTFATFSPRFGWIGADTLEDVAFDPKGGVLTGGTSGEGPGCGARGTWVFDAYAFALRSLRAGTDCAGPADPAAWPEVWAAGAP